MTAWRRLREATDNLGEGSHQKPGGGGEEPQTAWGREATNSLEEGESSQPWQERISGLVGALGWRAEEAATFTQGLLLQMLIG